MRKARAPSNTKSAPPSSPKPRDTPLWLWSKFTSARWEDAWQERLSFLPPGTLAIIAHPGSRAVCLRAYVDAPTGRRLARLFGGTLRKLSQKEWNRELDREIRPLSIRGKLIVFSRPEDWLAHRSGPSPIPSLHIPPSIAFGTGSHPTTAGCLRRLHDASRSLPRGAWHMADAGCGSGILALAALLLGAATAEAFDYDPHCVREARKNATLNRLKLTRLTRADAHTWQPLQPCDILTANLYTDILTSCATNLAAALKPGGILIFSGVLRPQLPQVLNAFTRAGLQPQSTNPRGKWVHGTCLKPT